MTDSDDLQGELRKIDEAEAQLRDLLSGQALEAALAPLHEKRKKSIALSGSGAVATDGGVAAGAGGVAVGGNVEGGVHVTIQTADRRGLRDRVGFDAARKHYLQLLSRYCESLPLAALGGEEGAEADLTLSGVYIQLDTTDRVPISEEEKEKKKKKERKSADFIPREETQSRPFTALEAAAKFPRLALLGDPGAGKSTFARSLIVRLAAHQLGQEQEPLPGIAGDLLPALIVLRELAPGLAKLDLDSLSGERAREALAGAVIEHAVEAARRMGAGAFAEGLRAALDSGRCLLVLDGLDEVPHDSRARARQAAAALVGRAHIQRILVTCRVRSYTGDSIFPDFDSRTLAPFDENKIRSFAARFYQAQRALGRVDQEQEKIKRDDLTRAALSHDLRKLSENPMLLTTMALIHQRDIGLPTERVRLYGLAVDVLLRRWQKFKFGSAELGNFLKDDLQLRGAMERLAYEAHRAGEKDKPADLPRGRALELLESPQHLGSAALAAEFLDYVDQRAGLLVGQGGEPGRPVVYTFPHRTFQEYLAGCYLVGQRDTARQYFAHAGEKEYWNVAAQLGAEELHYNRRGAHVLLDLAYQLCAAEPGDERSRRATLWSGNMAALIGRETVERDADSPNGGMNYLDKLIPRLVGLLDSELTAPERAEAGNTLAKLGDPRFRADAWHLPDEPLLGFVEIRKGEFIMGSDPKKDRSAYEDEQPQHKVTLPRYFIARYPVTVAQFGAFARESGYTVAAGLAPALHGVPNHPVVNVTWHDAIAYCDWLTETLKKWSGTPQPLAALLRNEKWRIILPSEAEWEKAARGGDGRLFPWGDEFDPNKANTSETGIGTTSTVGCFYALCNPEGLGLFDLSGNVLEWTRSLWGKDWEKPDFKYPYNIEDGRENLDASGNIRRVVRGGSWYLNPRSCRSAARRGNEPSNFYGNLGFRVALSPVGR